MTENDYGDYALADVYPDYYNIETIQGREHLCNLELERWEDRLLHQEQVDGSSCPPHWDRISCWPPTKERTTAVIPCFKELNGLLYDPSFNASLQCLDSGVWANKSDYSNCTPLQTPEEPSSSLHSTSLSNIYFTGYSISLVALIVAFCIFIYFKEMRCLRNKIHANLFLTYILANTCWILTAVMQEAHSIGANVEFSWCVSLVFLRYFHLATFFWMFVEGLYLFVQVIATFSVENSNIKLRHYVSIGWGFPLLIVVLWAIFTHSRATASRPELFSSLDNTSTKALEELLQPKCPFMERSYLEWIYIGPVLLLLGTNTFFLVSIFYVVVTKLRSTGRGEADHQNWKAAKALLVIIPLLGITYLITILGPTNTNSISYTMFVHVRAVLLSTQGFAVTLPYCFLNTEVRGIIRHHWNRHRAARYIEANYSRGQSARNSISLAGYYGCDTNTTHLSSSRRNSFLRLHAQYLSSTAAHPNPESQFVTSVVLERGGGNRIIPVIQEESDVDRSSDAQAADMEVTSSLLPTAATETTTTPATPAAVPLLSDSRTAVTSPSTIIKMNPIPNTGGQSGPPVPLDPVVTVTNPRPSSSSSSSSHHPAPETVLRDWGCGVVGGTGGLGGTGVLGGRHKTSSITLDRKEKTVKFVKNDLETAAVEKGQEQPASMLKVNIASCKEEGSNGSRASSSNTSSREGGGGGSSCSSSGNCGTLGKTTELPEKLGNPIPVGSRNGNHVSGD